MLRLLSERGLTGCVDASGVRTIICAGSKLDARTLEAARRWAPNATIFEYYGASELSFVSGAGLPAGSNSTPAARESAGRFPAWRSGSSTTAEPCSRTATAGNICVRSGMVSNGYLWGDDGQALRCFDGWFTVGDQGYLEDGSLHILGRRADMIITSGKNVYPHEVELALASVPGVAAAVAAGMRGRPPGPAGRGRHRSRRTAESPPPSSRPALEDVLARDKRPLQYFALSELPTHRPRQGQPELLLDWIAPRRPPGPAPWLTAAQTAEPLPPDRQPVIIAARRTPVCRANGALKDLRAHELLAPVLRSLLADSRRGPGRRGRRRDRQRRGRRRERGPAGALEAGLPVSVPGLTVDRQCGSGLDAIVLAARLVAAGGAACTSPGEWRASAPRRCGPTGTTTANPTFSPGPSLRRTGLGDPDMGVAAENVAARFGISRDRQDALALRSHRRALAAAAAGRFDGEIVQLAALRTGRPVVPRPR